MKVGKNDDGSYDNSKVDVFSAAVTAIAIHSGTSPFYCRDDEDNFQEDLETYNMLRDDKYDAFWEKAANVPWDPKPDYSEKFKKLIWDMLKYDPKDRITAEETFERTCAHKWNKFYRAHNEACLKPIIEE